MCPPRELLPLLKPKGEQWKQQQQKEQQQQEGEGPMQITAVRALSSLVLSSAGKSSDGGLTT